MILNGIVGNYANLALDAEELNLMAVAVESLAAHSSHADPAFDNRLETIATLLEAAKKLVHLYDAATSPDAVDSYIAIHDAGSARQAVALLHRDALAATPA